MGRLLVAVYGFFQVLVGFPRSECIFFDRCRSVRGYFCSLKQIAVCIHVYIMRVNQAPNGRGQPKKLLKIKKGAVQRLLQTNISLFGLERLTAQIHFECQVGFLKAQRQHMGMARL